jgi:hypothetical protein
MLKVEKEFMFEALLKYKKYIDGFRETEASFKRQLRLGFRAANKGQATEDVFHPDLSPECEFILGINRKYPGTVINRHAGYTVLDSHGNDTLEAVIELSRMAFYHVLEREFGGDRNYGIHGYLQGRIESKIRMQNAVAAHVLMSDYCLMDQVRETKGDLAILRGLDHTYLGLEFADLFADRSSFKNQEGKFIQVSIEIDSTTQNHDEEMTTRLLLDNMEAEEHRRLVTFQIFLNFYMKKNANGMSPDSEEYNQVFEKAKSFANRMSEKTLNNLYDIGASSEDVRATA